MYDALRVCVSERAKDDGYMGTALPYRVQVCNINIRAKDDAYS